DAAWSPAIARLAYAVEGRLYVQTPTGSRGLVMNGLDILDRVRWLDGRRLAVLRVAPHPGLYVVDAETHRTRRVTKGDTVASELSPDGTSLAYPVKDEALNRYTGELWIQNLVRGGGHRLVALNSSLGFQWSPDSTRIAFLDGHDPNGSKLYVASARGDRVRRVDSGQIEDVTWTGSG